MAASRRFEIAELFPQPKEIILGEGISELAKDVRAIQEFGKYVPAFAAFEKNRLRLYREAAQEAEDILNRWEDEIDEDDEPDEYFSD